MATEQTRQTEFDLDAAKTDALNYLENSKNADDILKYLAPLKWMQVHKTAECPPSAIPSVEDIEEFVRESDPAEKGTYIKGFEYDDFATHPIIMQAVFSLFLVREEVLAGVIADMHDQWRTIDGAKHPLGGIVEAWQMWQNRPRKPEQASVATAKNMTRIGYTNTNFLITRWQDLGVDVIEVDGMPIGKITNMPDGKQPRIYAPTQASIEKLTVPFPKKYNAMKHPIMLGYERLNTTMPESIRANRHTAKLLYMALAANSDIEVTLDEGAGLLVGGKGKDGKRKHGKIVKSDHENFSNAFWTLDGLRTFWDRNGKTEQFKLIRTDQSMNGYIFGPSTLMRQLRGYYTLSASFGPLSEHRIGELWLVLTACEYHLARGAFNPHEGIPKALIPIRKGGPGPWEKMPWRQFMNLHGDYWNDKDQRAENNAKRRYQIIRERLKNKILHADAGEK